VTTSGQRCVPLIMAAGLGTRMRSRTPKLLHPLLGRPMLAYVVEAATDATGERPVIVYSPHTDAVRMAFEGQAELALQDEPRGTGDAVRAGLVAVPADATELLVLNGDVPLVDPDLLRDLIEARREDAAAVAVLTVDAVDPGRLGRIVRDDRGLVDRIVEAKDATEEELAVSEINSGMYAIDLAWLRRRIGDLQPSAATGELYLTQIVELARHDGRLVAALEVIDDGTLLGINDRAELSEMVHRLQARINEGHLVAGVTMDDPTTAYIEATVELAQDVVLEPNVILRGRTRIGEGTRIGAGSQIADSVIGRDCIVWASVLETAEVEDGAQIGPFAHLRPGSSIGRGAKVGNYAEVKNSRLEAGVQQHHVSYLGDAHVGARANIGAGTITANYDGTRKLRTTIGDGAFIGVDTLLIAPVEVGDGAKTGAGAVVTHDVPAGALAVGVPARIRERRVEGAGEAAAPGAEAPGTASRPSATEPAANSATDAD
jgi:bifunctional UDP-N-acetylglucosamine pyrophosphorylase/glucosamine-1-phosphate N-acetyltransferase